MEFGATTGRPRRCGWAGRDRGRNDAVRLNGLTGIAVTKLDVLSGSPVLKIANGYDLEGKTFTTMPSNIRQAERVVPRYEEMPGWQKDISGVRQFEDLPSEAKDYIRRIEDFTGTPAVIVSVGPDRSETLLLKNPFEKC